MSTGTPAAQENLPRAERFIEQRWVQRAVCAVALVVPLGLGILLSLKSLGAAIDVAALLGCMGLAYGMAVSFDPGMRVPFLRFRGGVMGRAMKLLALFHAVAALKLGYEMFQEESFTELNNEIPLGVKLIVLGWLWGVAAVAYLAGDARVRRARRDAEIIAGADSSGPTPRS